MYLEGLECHGVVCATELMLHHLRVGEGIKEIVCLTICIGICMRVAEVCEYVVSLSLV